MIINNFTRLEGSDHLQSAILSLQGIDPNQVKLIHSEQQFARIKEVTLETVFIITPQADHTKIITLLEELCVNWPCSKKIAIVRSDFHSGFIQDLFVKGVHGVISRNSIDTKMAKAILAVSNNNLYTDIAIKTKLKEQYAEDEESLTPREQQIIIFIIQGLTSQEIADKLCLSEHTIKSHRKLINKKLKVHSPVQLVKYAINHDLYF
jgi:DNA-binding NarL/FixJ family response regulator